MYKMMYLERYANYFQDPDNMGYAPIILSLGSIDSIRAAVASPVHGIPVVRIMSNACYAAACR